MTEDRFTNTERDAARFEASCRDHTDDDPRADEPDPETTTDGLGSRGDGGTLLVALANAVAAARSSRRRR